MQCKTPPKYFTFCMYKCMELNRLKWTLNYYFSTPSPTISTGCCLYIEIGEPAVLYLAHLVGYVKQWEHKCRQTVKSQIWHFHIISNFDHNMDSIFQRSHKKGVAENGYKTFEEKNDKKGICTAAFHNQLTIETVPFSSVQS